MAGKSRSNMFLVVLLYILETVHKGVGIFDWSLWPSLLQLTWWKGELVKKEASPLNFTGQVASNGWSWPSMDTSKHFYQKDQFNVAVDMLSLQCMFKSSCKKLALSFIANTKWRKKFQSNPKFVSTNYNEEVPTRLNIACLRLDSNHTFYNWGKTTNSSF